MMRSLKVFMFVPALMVAAACGDKATDASLDNDLKLAGQAYSPADSISALERQNAQNALVTPRRTTSAPARRRASSGSSGGTYSAPAPARTTTVKKNTGRDAAIGAAAGAIIGATTSKDKVKGGLIGAVIGGAAGAVIGNNVDVKKKTQ